MWLPQEWACIWSKYKYIVVNGEPTEGAVGNSTKSMSLLLLLTSHPLLLWNNMDLIFPISIFRCQLICRLPTWDLINANVFQVLRFGVNVFTGSMLLLTPNHSFKSCASPEALTSSTTFNKYGGRNSFGGQKYYMLKANFDCLHPEFSYYL